MDELTIERLRYAARAFPDARLEAFLSFNLFLAVQDAVDLVAPMSHATRRRPS